MYTHLAQFQASCWKHWNINNIPNALFEKREYDRSSSNLMGWWGPAKGVPLLVFVASGVPFQEIEPVSIRKMQDLLQEKMKQLFRALHLVPHGQAKSDNAPVEVKSLFLLPSTSQPIIHIIPSSSSKIETKQLEFSFSTPISLDDYSTPTPTKPESLQYDYGHRLLKNFVAIWQKTATTRHPMYHRNKTVPLPTPLQIISALVVLRCFIFSRQTTEKGIDFKQVIIQPFPSTKGMMHQIEVILRKKIADHVEMERTFSKHQCLDVMRRANVLYLQDSPPYYTEQYHLWKLNNVLRVYRSLARGPCLEEYAARLEKECDEVWRTGRQGCENISLTGNPCRLSMGHEQQHQQQEQALSRESKLIHGNKHNSGVTFIHACNCGKSQMSRDDPFDIMDANINFYLKFDCCCAEASTRAVDIENSIFGKDQNLTLVQHTIPRNDISMLYLGPSEMYRPGAGLDHVEGFMNSTKRLILWSLGTISDLKTAEAEDHPQSASSVAILRKSNDIEWPELGKAVPLVDPHITTSPANTVSLEAFPALGKAPAPAAPAPAAAAAVPPIRPVLEKRNNNGNNRRRRGERKRRRPVGVIRGYIGAEYECPHGHRFMSCGDGRVCKVGHASHPKEHGNYFVHQDLPVYILCPCTYANGQHANNIEVVAQLQRLYAVTPSDEPITMSIEPKIKITMGDKEIELDFGINEGGIRLGPNGFYVLRLPFIYRDNEGHPIPIEPDIQKKLKSAVLLKDCFKFQHTKSEKWV
ncbi:hypothetical protein K501DRAFT_192408 [Backusella circina FSU 941]|nr:hypothetical protein K501DRAFT_192408 [Backusella circina FSU 941]